MLNKKGVKIVLTASATEMSDFGNVHFFAFSGGFPKGIIPIQFLRRRLYPQIESNSDGTAKYAPYGLRKVEAILLQNGFDESDVVVVHPNNLSKFVGLNTKVVGISTMDPLGMGYVSKTYSSLIGGGKPINSIEFRNLVKHCSFRRYKPKIIVGGAEAWQLKSKNLVDSCGIHCVVIGENETTLLELFKKAVHEENLPRIVDKKKYPKLTKVPRIRHASIHGVVEITRGCGRNCQFCTPTMQKRVNFPIEEIMQEVEINVKEGSKTITLATEDILLYGATNDGFIPNKK